MEPSLLPDAPGASVPDSDALLGAIIAKCEHHRSHPRVDLARIDLPQDGDQHLLDRPVLGLPRFVGPDLADGLGVVAEIVGHTMIPGLGGVTMRGFMVAMFCDIISTKAAAGSSSIVKQSQP